MRVSPATTVGGSPDFSIIRSVGLRGDWLTRVSSESSLGLPGSAPGSVGLVTPAVLVTVVGSGRPWSVRTSTQTDLLSPAGMVPRLQVTVPPDSEHPGEALAKSVPVGTSSVTSTSWASEGPLLVTSIW